MNVFELFATLSLDTSNYDNSLDDAEKSASSFGSKLKNGLATAGKVTGVAIGAVTAATGAITTAMVSGTKQTAAYADNIDKMSQKMGISATAYQEWEAVMQHSGTSMETLKAGMKTLANAVENGNDAFERLGITQDDIASMNQEDLFSTTITALQNVENETERTYLAGQLLGRGATELGALLNTSAEDTQAMKDRVHELGGVLDDEAVKAGAAFQDQLQDMQTAMSSLGRNLTSKFLPSITSVMGGLTEIFAGNDDTGIPAIEAGISQFTDKLASSMPRILQIGTQIVNTLLNAIVNNLPQLIEAGTQAIIELGKGLIDNLPQIVDAALEVIKALANGLIEALPELIPAVVEVVLQIVDSLVNNVDLLIEAATQLIIGLAKGLIAAVPILIEKAPQIIASLVKGLISALPQVLAAGVQLIGTLVEGIGSAFVSLVNIGKEFIPKIWEGFKQKIEDAKNWGKDLIKNFKEGITQKWEDLKSGVKGIAEGIKGFLGFSEPEEGPLSNFHTYAPDMMKLFAKGIKDNEDLVYNQIEDSFDFANKIGDMDSLGVTTSGNNTINHTGTIRLEGVNDQGQFIAASEYAIEDIIVKILKRQVRLA